jgi:hypothetical protein
MRNLRRFPTLRLVALGSASHPYHFYCPDLAAVDQYLAALGKHIRSGACLVPGRIAAVRRDIDRLLDRNGRAGCERFCILARPEPAPILRFVRL